MDDGAPDRQASGTGPQDNVPQEQVQTTPLWDTGGEKSTGDAIHEGIYQHVSDENRDAGAQTPTTANVTAQDSSMAGQQDRNPTTYGGLGEGQPASGATTNPEKTVDADDRP